MGGLVPLGYEAKHRIGCRPGCPIPMASLTGRRAAGWTLSGK